MIHQHKRPPFSKGSMQSMQSMHVLFRNVRQQLASSSIDHVGCCGHEDRLSSVVLASRTTHLFGHRGREPQRLGIHWIHEGDVGMGMGQWIRININQSIACSDYIYIYIITYYYILLHCTISVRYVRCRRPSLEGLDPEIPAILSCKVLECHPWPPWWMPWCRTCDDLRAAFLGPVVYGSDFNGRKLHGFYHQIWGFPVNLPIIQFYEGWVQIARIHQNPPGTLVWSFFGHIVPHMVIIIKTGERHPPIEHSQFSKVSSGGAIDQKSTFCLFFFEHQNISERIRQSHNELILPHLPKVFSQIMEPSYSLCFQFQPKLCRDFSTWNLAIWVKCCGNDIPCTWQEHQTWCLRCIFSSGLPFFLP